MSAAEQIHSRLASVLAEVEAITKDRNNAAQGFKFRGVDDVYNSLHPLFAKHGIYVRPEVLAYVQTERTTKGGAPQLHSVVKMRYHFTAMDGSSTAMEIPGEAADSGDKGLGKACQYAYKLLLLQMFLIPTEGDNDPDAQATEWGRAAPADERRRRDTRPERPRQAAPPAEPSEDEVKVIAPWLTLIVKAGLAGGEALDEAIERLEGAVQRKQFAPSPAQDAALRRAIATARTAIADRERRRAAGEAEPGELPPIKPVLPARQVRDVEGDRPRGPAGYGND